jgi:hypothetical protein
MTTQHDLDALLTGYMAEGMNVLPDRVADAVLDEAHRTRQRVVFGPRRTPVMNSTLKAVLAAAAVIAVLVAGINFLPRNDAAVAGPSSTRPSTSSPPSPSQQVDRMGLGGTNQHFNVDLPEGWENNEWVANNHPLGGDTSFIVGLVDNTFEDPCLHIERNPKVGPTVEDLATALGEIPGTTATEPVQTTIAGYDATYVEVTHPGPPPCEEFVWYQESPGNYWWVVEADERFSVWILELDGQRVAIGARSYPDTPQQAKDELRDILDSIVFDEASPGSAGPS